jgi:hypothetical protein
LSSEQRLVRSFGLSGLDTTSSLCNLSKSAQSWASASFLFL